MRRKCFLKDNKEVLSKKIIRKCFLKKIIRKYILNDNMEPGAVKNVQDVVCAIFSWLPFVFLVSSSTQCVKK